jgi:aminoglycoside phosphotransferase
MRVSSDDVWQLVAPAGTLRFDLPASSSARRRLALHLRTLPAGATIVLRCVALGSRWRCRRFARDAGVELVREYVAVPSIDPPTCYVEDSPSALRYFFRQLLTLPRGGAALSFALEAIKWIAGLSVPAGMAGSLAPIRIALGRIPASPAHNAIADPSGANPLFDEPDTQSLVLALSKDPNAKLTMLLIPKGSDRPTLAVKVPTTAEAEGSIAAERRVLSDMNARLPGTILASIPRIGHDWEVGGRAWLVTTALAGSPMTTRYHAWRHLATPAAVREDFEMVEAWLATFQSASAGPRGPIDMNRGGADVLRRRFTGEAMLDDLLSRLAAVHARLGTTSTPRTAVHGDFWFGNLLIAGGKISGVIDWEAGAVSGEPVRDLVRFALSYALYLDRHTRPGRLVAGHRGLRAGEWGSGITWAIGGDGWFPDLVQEFVRGGLRRLGADPDCWREAMLAGLADVAATADHADFARRHWQLFGRLTSTVGVPPPPGAR